MELRITQQKENALLHRKEIMASVTFDKATPSNVEVSKALATKLSVSEDSLIVKHITGGFGKLTAVVTAYVYESKEQKAKIEPKVKAKKAADGAAAPAAK
jgi:small subunit ribosomal protein S24e